VLFQGLWLAAFGIVAGLVAAFALTQLMEGLLYEVGSHDPVIFLGVPATLLVVALVASVVPARRAIRVSPAIALRPR